VDPPDITLEDAIARIKPTPRERGFVEYLILHPGEPRARAAESIGMKAKSGSIRMWKRPKVRALYDLLLKAAGATQVVQREQRRREIETEDAVWSLHETLVGLTRQAKGDEPWKFDGAGHQEFHPGNARRTLLEHYAGKDAKPAQISLSVLVQQLAQGKMEAPDPASVFEVEAQEQLPEGDGE
jgi:hypothetical protein